LWAVRRLLANCRNEPPAAEGSNELAFIDEEEWRNTLRSDLGAVEAALHNHEWKAATVLGGSLVEALLLWAVGRHSAEERKEAIACTPAPFGKPPDPSSPESWDLIHYVEVARALTEISENTATQARLAKDFRNLIHPGRERRQRMRANRGTALSVAAAVEQVIGDLSARHRRFSF
jgi:hypothetical protein